MTERPILFTGPMVRAILDGRKTMTRRVVDLSRVEHAVHGIGIDEETGDWHAWDIDAPHGEQSECWHSTYVRCPYGQPGDRLWVKESAYIAPKNFSDDDDCIDYDGDHRTVGYAATMDADSVRCATDYGVKKTPSIYMPRWASRITLEVTGVRVERVQEISEADALAEGVEPETFPKRKLEPVTKTTVPLSPVACFSILWDSINVARGYGWVTNPWVWVVEFRRLRGEA